MSRSRTIRIGVIADTHGLFDPAIVRHFQGVDHILHAGDIGKRSVIEQLQIIAPVTAVSGNIDEFEQSGFPPETVIELAGKTAVNPLMVTTWSGSWTTAARLAAL